MEMFGWILFALLIGFVVDGFIGLGAGSLWEERKWANRRIDEIKREGST